MLQSTLLSGNTRLEKASLGPPSIRKRPPDDDADAIRRIQKALSSFGFSMPKSFPNGPGLEPDGLFGPETEKAVHGFQKQAFPNKMSEWDGRCGPKTLAEMDARLGTNKVAKPVYVPPKMVVGVCRCARGNPDLKGKPRSASPASPMPIPYPHIGKAKNTASTPTSRYNLIKAWPPK